MKLLTKILSGAFLSAMVTLSAQNCCPPQTDCNPCCDWFSDCEFSVFGEYLYWDVCRSSGQLASVTTTSATDFALLHFGSNYQSGYRVGGSLQASCWNFLVRYTSIDSTKSLVQPQAAGEYSLREGFDYSVVDIQLGREIYLRGLCGSLTPFIGLKFGWIDETMQIEEVAAAVTTATVKNDLSSYGVSLGANFYWQIWKECIPVAFIARGSVALLKGRFQTPDAERFVDGVLNETMTSFNRCTMNFVPNLYVGLDFDLFCCDCFNVNAQLGYEAEIWTSYLFAPGDITLGGRKSGILALNGLVARFQIGF